MTQTADEQVPRPDRSAAPILAVEGVGKSFGGERALEHVRFDLRAGEVHALMGENGAGKSTLMKVLAGVHQPDEGRVLVDGEPVSIDGPRAAAALGIAIIHQELNTIPEMTVAENLALGSEPTRLGVVDFAAMVRGARERLERIGSTIDPRARMGSLSVGQQQMVEIARAVAADARVLILDEPTAALSDGESRRLFALIDEMRARGLAMIYISHRMEEVWRLADRITVLRDGRYVATSDRGELTPEQVVTQMIGRDVDALYVRDDHELGEPSLEVDALEGDGGIGPVSFHVRAGEVVGLVGLIGAGRTEIARLIAGVDRPIGGSVRVAGQPTRFRSPTDAIAGGVGFLPESRKEQALFQELSISDNVIMAALPRYSRLGPLRRGAIAKAVQRQMKALRIRATTPRRVVSALSGGNQQKVVLGRWLTVGPRVLILDEPTRGVDIGAKAEIYRTINELAKDGVAILVVSSDLPEALGISDRVLVVRDGRIVRELGWEHATEEEVMLAATGVGRGDEGRQAQGGAR